MNNLRLLTDTELVLAYQNNTDKQIYGEIYKRYNQKIYRYCCRLLNDTDMALDATQDIFVKVSDRVLKLRYAITFSNWLYQVAHNHCMDILKNKKHKYAILDYKVYEIENENYNLDYDLNKVNRIQQLSQLMNNIPDKDKEMLEAKYLEKKSIIDLMEIYDLSESAVKMRLARARQKVKKLFEANQLDLAL